MDLHEKYKNVIVDRNGDILNSNMVTLKITKEIFPKVNYRVTKKSLVPSNNSSKFEGHCYQGTEPQKVIVVAQWKSDPDGLPDSSNILGSLGLFIVNENEIKIPKAETNRENLGYYGAKLLEEGDILRFETDKEIPLTEVYVGSNYIDGYILNEKYANGVYIEKHNRPHFHKPLNKEATGYLILGRSIGDNLYAFSAFSIPYGYAVYTPPNTIHNDCFLIGKYAVVYSVTPEYSTVRICDQNYEMIKVEIE